MKNYFFGKITAPGSNEWANAIGLFLVRFGFGFIMLFGHGWPKWMNYSLMESSFPDPLGIGNSLSLLMVIFAEVVGSLLLMAGLFTRLALLPLVFTMLVAFFVVHGSDPFANRELALIYLLVFSALLFTGPGRFSADYYLNRKTNQK